MDRLFHCCIYINSDGTRKLITHGENCLVRTNKCLWKNSHDVITHIKTRSMTKNEDKASLKIKMIISRTKKRQ